MTMVSEHFSTEELSCRCGECEFPGIDPKLVEGLEELRSIVNEPIIINSGYRCPTHNRKIGGSKNSQHTYARAADIRTKSGMEPYDLAALASGIDCFNNGGIGTYPYSGFVHLDVRGHRARWEEKG